MYWSTLFIFLVLKTMNTECVKVYCILFCVCHYACELLFSVSDRYACVCVCVCARVHMPMHMIQCMLVHMHTHIHHCMSQSMLTYIMHNENTMLVKTQSCTPDQLLRLHHWTISSNPRSWNSPWSCHSQSIPPTTWTSGLIQLQVFGWLGLQDNTIFQVHHPPGLQPIEQLPRVLSHFQHGTEGVRCDIWQNVAVLLGQLLTLDLNVLHAGQVATVGSTAVELDGIVGWESAAWDGGAAPEEVQRVDHGVQAPGVKEACGDGSPVALNCCYDKFWSPLNF